MADIRRDWLTNQNTDWCFVVIGLVGRQSHSPLQQLKIDPVCQMCPPYWLASSGCRRIFNNICGQYGIQKNIYIHPCSVDIPLKCREKSGNLMTTGEWPLSSILEYVPEVTVPDWMINTKFHVMLCNQYQEWFSMNFIDHIHCVQKKNTHSHFLPYLHEWCVDLNKNCSEYT